MNNIFSALRTYAGKWSVKDTRDFTPEEIGGVKKAVVVSSSYGMSVCFYMRSGGMTFIPLDQNSSAGLGEEINLSKAKLITLGKDGEADIVRVSI